MQAYPSTEFELTDVVEAPRERVTGVRPSAVSGERVSFEQELTVFGHWSGSPTWVPPRNASLELAQSMLEYSSPRDSFEKRWRDLAQRCRKQFTQVRELDVAEDSIRLPKGCLFVTVTEKKDFDTITDKVPACVRTRLEEFLAGPGHRPGVQVYYLKPLCVEVDEKLIFTTAEELQAAIGAIQDQVQRHYSRKFVPHHLQKFVTGVTDSCLAWPRHVLKQWWAAQQRAIDVYQSKLEYERRKMVMEALEARRKCRTDDCTFDEFLSVTREVPREEVILRFAAEQALTARQRKELLMTAGQVSLPWFISLSCSLSLAASLAAKLAVVMAPPVVVCDPVFVAEMPEARGELLKIGHFDEIGGVMHVEI
jgi:hypothetical protein